jgi:hypothetical protein
MQISSTRPFRAEYKSKEQIAAELGISLRTLQRKLQKAGLDVPRGFLSPETQNLIYTRLGCREMA